jgi:hypothetical protein
MFLLAISRIASEGLPPAPKKKAGWPRASLPAVERGYS